MRPTDRRPRHHRGGFTLVELLVAAALSLVVMTVLSLAFQTGLQTLSQLKSVVGMAEQLRSAESVIRRDLGAPHLETSLGSPVRVRNLAQVPPGETLRGAFRFRQGDAASLPTGRGPEAEGRKSATPYGDSEGGVLSFRTPNLLGNELDPSSLLLASNGGPLRNELFAPATPTGRAWADFLQVTVTLSGASPQELFTTTVDPAILTALRAAGAIPSEIQSAAANSTDQFVSRSAEVSYFLRPTGPGSSGAVVVQTSEEGGVRQLPLYTLYRRVRLLVPQTVVLPPSVTLTQIKNSPGLAIGVVRDRTSSPAGNPTTTYQALGMADNPTALSGGLTPANSTIGMDQNANDPSITFQPVHLMGSLGDPLAPTLPGSLTASQQTWAARAPYPIPSGTNDYGSDLLVTNVVSMTVRPVYDIVFQTSTNAAYVPGGVQSSYQPRDLPEFGRPSDTPDSNVPGWPRMASIPGRPSQVFLRDPLGTAPNIVSGIGSLRSLSPDFPAVTLKAVEVKLRVYDAKNKTSRQMTVLQDL